MRSLFRMTAICVVLVSAFTSLSSAALVRTFVPGKPWEVTIEANGFEPCYSLFLADRTILGGHIQKGIIITIIVEKEETHLTPQQAREKYSGDPPDCVEEPANIQDMIVVSWKYLTKTHGEGSRTVHGFTTKEDISFDIHLSVDLAKQTKEQIFTLLRSFKVAPSSEPKDIDDLMAKLGEKLSPKAREDLMLAFGEKYPDSPIAPYGLAEDYITANRMEDAEQAYLKAVKNHRTEPLANPNWLWACYDGLGMCYGMKGMYEPAKKYFDLGYELANEIEDEELQCQSAYNLACWYAENDDIPNACKFLKEAMEILPEKRQQAMEDSSFQKIRNKKEFLDALK